MRNLSRVSYTYPEHRNRTARQIVWTVLNEETMQGEGRGEKKMER